MCLLPGPLILEKGPLNALTPILNMNWTVSRQSKPNSNLRKKNTLQPFFKDGGGNFDREFFYKKRKRKHNKRWVFYFLGVQQQSRWQLEGIERALKEQTESDTCIHRLDEGYIIPFLKEKKMVISFFFNLSLLLRLEF